LIDEPVKPARPIAIVPIGDEANGPAAAIAERLRDVGFVVDLGYSGNLQRRMRRADRVGARAAVIFGSDELAAGTLTLRDFETGEQLAVRRDEKLTDLVAKLKALS
jgi:histidyl-tRNA synthetase